MSAAQIVIVALALVLANLPFATRRVFFVWSNSAGEDKSLWWRVVELLFLYFLIGLTAAWIESRSYGGVYAQDWQFFAITFCLFVVFAFPGFVFRYLWHHRLG